MEIGDPPFKRCEVVWLDAHVDTHSITVKKAEKIEPVVTYTLGYLIAENDDGVVMVTDCYPDHKKEGRIPNFIPHEIIESITTWED